MIWIYIVAGYFAVGILATYRLNKVYGLKHKRGMAACVIFWPLLLLMLVAVLIVNCKLKEVKENNEPTAEE